MIKIIADRNLYKLQGFLPPKVEVTHYNPQKPIDLTINPDAWLLNTVTKVTPANFPKLPTSLKFIGTGSSGSDHLDKEYLTKKGIFCEDAKGCNAQAVAEYILTALLLLKEEKGVDFRTKRIGIVGVGAVGSRVHQLLEKFGSSSVLYDPPRAELEPKFNSATLDELLACDILTLHTPLVKSGTHSTLHWLDEEKLAGRSFDVIINAARGGVTDEQALLGAVEKGYVSHIITDVWENEPDFNLALMDASFIATPHIAGYSVQSKLNASRIISEKFCHFFELESPPILPFPNAHLFEISNTNSSYREIIGVINPILDYDYNLRSVAHLPRKSNEFIALRNSTPLRQEYRFIEFPQQIDNNFKLFQLFD